MQTATYEYPVALGLAYILLVGCLQLRFQNQLSPVEMLLC